MKLSDIGMIASDTSRSKIYLKSLVANDLIPNSVIVLKNLSANHLPGQVSAVPFLIPQDDKKYDKDWSESFYDANFDIEEYLQENHIPFVVSPSHDMNDRETIEVIKSTDEKTLIYSGYGGTLLRSEVLGTGKNFLHIHGGYIPDYKGSTTNYYSVIEDDSLGASSIFLTEEIDGGPLFIRKKFSANIDKQLIDHIFDTAARAKVLINTLQKYLEVGSWEKISKENQTGDTYYIIHPVLKHIAILS